MSYAERRDAGRQRGDLKAMASQIIGDYVQHPEKYPSLSAACRAHSYPSNDYGEVHKLHRKLQLQLRAGAQRSPAATPSTSPGASGAAAAPTPANSARNGDPMDEDDAGSVDLQAGQDLDEVKAALDGPVRCCPSCCHLRRLSRSCGCRRCPRRTGAARRLRHTAKPGRGRAISTRLTRRRRADPSSFSVQDL